MTPPRPRKSVERAIERATERATAPIRGAIERVHEATPVKTILDRLAEEGVEQRARHDDFERQVDDAVAAAKRHGVDLDPTDAGYAVAFERSRIAEEQRKARLAEAMRFVEAAAARPGPARRQVEEWTRDDFIGAVEQDQAAGGGGGKRSVANRIPGMSPSALYRRWQKVAGAGVPWPSGKKGPPTRT